MKGPQAGEVAEIVFVPEEHSCFLNYDGKFTKLAQYIPSDTDNDKANLYLPGDYMLTMDASENDVSRIQAFIQSDI